MIAIQPKGQNTILPGMQVGSYLSLMEKHVLFLQSGRKKISNSHEGSKLAKSLTVPLWHFVLTIEATSESTVRSLK